MLSAFDDEFLKKNSAIIDGLLSADVVRHKPYHELVERNNETRNWLRDVRSHLATTERIYQNVCINV